MAALAPVLQTEDIEADKVMRLRPNRCLWGEPPPYDGHGRPKKHGAKFKLSAPTTWGIPIESIEVDDPTWGKVEIQQRIGWTVERGRQYLLNK